MLPGEGQEAAYPAESVRAVDAVQPVRPVEPVRSAQPLLFRGLSGTNRA